ncbi:MAG TPA: DNA metabolism protein, partial [Chryseosolibacter sp.]
MTTHLVYDGTFDGFLSCIFEVYDRKLSAFSIVRRKHLQPSLSMEQVHVPTDSAKSQRVWTGLKKHLSNTKCNELYKSFLSELPEIEQ